MEACSIASRVGVGVFSGVSRVYFSVGSACCCRLRFRIPVLFCCHSFANIPKLDDLKRGYKDSEDLYKHGVEMNPTTGQQPSCTGMFAELTIDWARSRS